jgi:ABC-type lipoprotein export system ATPase subunit
MDHQQETELPGEQPEAERAPLLLRVEQVSKSYPLPSGRLQILQEMAFQVQPGEFVAITGPSGSGKTTLLSLLGALESPDSGEIWLEDTAVHRLRGPAAADFRREQIGLVFQLFYLLPNLTALENVMVPLLPYRRKLSFNLKERAEELLERVGLADRLNHPPARLSGGEQQRVAIARALINRPKLVLADEPTGNLDPATGLEVLETLRELQRTGRQTLLMVTHDPQLAALADRRIRLDHLN